jgi:quercetin dioxygenase-like cupin family protein
MNRERSFASSHARLGCLPHPLPTPAFPIRRFGNRIQFMANNPGPVLKLNDLFQISGWQSRLKWQPFTDGVDIYRLYENGPGGPTAALLRFHPGGRVPLHEHAGYEHIFVLAGAQVDEVSKAEAGALVINPPGTSHSILSETGCIVLAIYEKPVKFLESPPPDGAAAP